MGDPETCKPALIQTRGKCKEESSSTSFPPSCNNQHIWNPSNSNFEPYLSVTAPRSRQINNHQRIVVKLTKDVVDTYHNCDQSFIYSEASNPLCYLTKPFFPTSNGGFDNENSDLILAVNAVLSNEEMGSRYIIKALLGQGTFGQVAKCWSDEWNTFVAVKVIKNQRAYYQQATVEIAMLKRLNTEFDPEDKHHIVRMLDCFIHQQHLCIVFELLGYDLFELLKINKYKGISLNLVRDFCVQILSALEVLSDASIIHCDLKPENIMLTTCLTSPKLKVIDFGSSCMENRPAYSYIQSRSYRSPEVILGHKYTTAIDIWSFGCIAAELFLGVPLFPAKSEYDLLQRMIMILGDTPPEDILCNAKKSEKYFKLMKVPTQCNNFSGNRFVFQFLTQEEYDSVNQKKAILGKHYFSADWNLEQIIMNYPMNKLKSIEEIDKENNERLVFIDFLKGLLNLDPVERWTASEIRAHPFITNEPFTGSYQPPRRAQKMHIYQGIMVDHNPDLGHWSAVGLSPPQMGPNPNAFIHMGSPQFFLGSSYSSAGSLGDGSIRLESSPWVYANSVGLYSKHQSPSSFGNEWSGYSPLQRMGHFPQLAIGYRCLAGSPIAGSFTPVSLGASPLNLAHAYSHLSPGSPSSITSPNRQGPISPARISNGSATALGKAAVIGQFNKRMGLGSPVSVMDRNSSTSSSYVESSLQGLNLGSPGSPTQHASQFGREASIRRRRVGDFMNYPLGSLGALLSKLEPNSHTGEDTLLQPDYGEGELSEELLFEDDTTDLMSAGGPSASSSRAA